MIYDQYYLMSLGLVVSWQNPDIQILRNGVPVASAYDLEPATTYEIVATIWNGSTSGVISGMPVSFSLIRASGCKPSRTISARSRSISA